MVKYEERNSIQVNKNTEKADKLLGDMINDKMEQLKSKNKKEMDKRYRPEDYVKK